MSGWYRTNEESCEPLKAYFVEIVEQGEPPPWQWLAIWHRLVGDPWFGVEVELCAKRAVKRRRLPYGTWRDVWPEVMVLFAGKLKDDPHLHARRDELADDFRAWMGTIIYRACGEVLDRGGETRRRDAMLIDWPLTECE